ncbi:MAG: signal peptidase II [Chloroflexi bacterium]|nr:MAG: signal peptidase II [Chloroflexota bacterium]
MPRHTAAGLALAVALVVAVLDQASKAWARIALHPGHEISVISGWLWFRLERNTGATFGLLSGHNWLFIAFSFVVVLAVVILVLRRNPVDPLGVGALGAIAGGGSSNLLDRVRFGGVTDFIEIHLWPTNFNLADAAIRIGVVMFILALLLELRRARRPGSI